MNPRNTFLLVLLAGGLFAFIFFYERNRSVTPPPPPKLLPGLRAETTTAIQIQIRNQEEIRAERTNESWQITRPINYPAQPLAVENLLRSLQLLAPQNHISAQELKGNRNLNADYGFDAPLVTLVIQQGDESRQLKLGRLTPPGDQVYAQVVGSEGVDIVGIDVFKYIPSQVDIWRDTTFVNLKSGGFDRITVVHGAKSFELQRDPTNSLWYTNPRDRVNVAKIHRLLEQLQSLRVHHFQTDDPKADLESFGLQPPELEVDFSRGTNRLIALQFGKNPTNDIGLVYARRDGQNTVMLVPGGPIAGWRAEKIEFRDRTLAGMYTWAPDQIEVVGRGTFTVQRVTNDAWRVAAPFDFPADTNLMKQFIVTLARMQVVPTNGPVAVKDIVPPSEWPNYGLGPPKWKYILKQNNTNLSALGSNTVMAELDFGTVTNGDTIYARRPEEPSVYAVALADFQQLPFSGYQLHERRIWDFTEDQVARIIIRQDGKPMELVHKAANEWGISAGSQGSINSLMVEVGAQELGVLAAENFVDRGNQNRAGFGFTDKSLQISVMVKRPAGMETLMIEFGGWSLRGLRYGQVELDGQQWIFEFPAVIYDRLISYFNLQQYLSPAAPAVPPAVKPETTAPAK